MKKISLLDCTLRDGGYINNWNFGKDNIEYTVRELEKSGTEILDLGFIRDEAPNDDRTVYNSIESLSKLFRQKNPNVTYAAMAEVLKPMAADKICEHSDNTVDVIRVIIWKDKHDEKGNVIDALQEGYEYCKIFADKGYKLYIQPARVEQYSDEEFKKMLLLYSKLKPAAIYVVDSWGTMYSDEVEHYFRIADEILDKSIAIGFHGHNNMMQAFTNAVDFINYDTDREIIIDGSVYGLGRGAGNLNIELFAKYLNEKEGKKYNIISYFNIYEKYIRAMKKTFTWGFSPAYFLTAYYHANPQYGAYYGIEKDLDSTVIDGILRNMPTDERIMYTRDVAEKYL